MKKITLLAVFLATIMSYGQTISGFVTNPSFDDGPAVTIPRNQTIDYWKYEGANATTPASIQTTDVQDGANALEITNTVVDGEWKNQMISTSYPFAGDNTNPISVSISFWAKTSDVNPASENSSGDLKILLRDAGSLEYGTTSQTNNGYADKTVRAILTTGTWSYITKTFNDIPAATSYDLHLRFQLGKLNGTTLIDGITTSVSGGATLLPTGPGATLPYEENFNFSNGESLSDQTNWSTPVEPYSGFVANPSFEDGSTGQIARFQTLNNWKLGGSKTRESDGTYAYIQSDDVHEGDGSNALKVISTGPGGFWNIRVFNNPGFAFDGDGINPIDVTLSFWAKTTDVATDEIYSNYDGDLRVLVKDTGSSNLGDKNARVAISSTPEYYKGNSTTPVPAMTIPNNTWVYRTETFTYPAANDYNIALYLEFGDLDGTTVIDGLTVTVTGGATLGPSSGPNDIVASTGNLSYSGLKTSENNKITLGNNVFFNTDVSNPWTQRDIYDNGFKESHLTFANQTSGTIYYSFIMKVNEVDDDLAVGDKDSFAGFSKGFEGTYDNLGATLWVEKASDTSYKLGINSGVDSTAVQLDATEYNEDDILFVVVGLDLDNDEAKLWVNPTSEDLANNVSVPSETQVATGATLSNVKAFSFHQEYSKVPDLDIDELRIGTSWADVTPPSIRWTGATDNDWNTSTNWTPETVPYATAEAIIPGGLTNYPTAQSAVDVNSVRISNGGSLIANSTFSGDVTYTRSLASTNWYLVSSPVTGQDIDTFANAAGLAVGGGNNMGLGYYDNAASSWSYYQSGATGSGDFEIGSGRSIKLASAGDISFSGTMPTDDVSISIANGFNLLGNPFPSFIGVTDILNTNIANLSEGTLWLWDQATDSYDALNLANSGSYISPAQGFFVETSGSNSFSINESMQSHQSTDSFQRLSNERPEIRLVLTDGENTRDTNIYYIEGTTTGFDNGYDSTTFGGYSNNFEIYTHLVANSNGEDFAIQSLPPASYETMIIPVGITAAAGEELSISANALNLPEGINIYLEDKLDNSFTLLDSTSTFTTITNEDLNGIGRFYIHTTSSALGDNEVSLINISMYVINRDLTITGVQGGDANVRIYDLQGKEVHSSSFQGTGLNKITLPKLAVGVYVAQLETQIEAISKKIIIKN